MTLSVFKRVSQTVEKAVTAPHLFYLVIGCLCVSYLKPSPPFFIGLFLCRSLGLRSLDYRLGCWFSYWLCDWFGDRLSCRSSLSLATVLLTASLDPKLPCSPKAPRDLSSCPLGSPLLLVFA